MVADKRLSLIRAFLKNYAGTHDQETHTPKEDLGSMISSSPVSALFARAGTKYSSAAPLAPINQGQIQAAVQSADFATRQTAATAAAAAHPKYVSPGKVRDKPKKPKKQPKGKKPHIPSAAEIAAQAKRAEDKKKEREWKPAPIIEGGVVKEQKLSQGELDNISSIAESLMPPGGAAAFDPNTTFDLLNKFDEAFQGGVAMGDKSKLAEGLGILEAVARINGMSREQFTTQRNIAFQSAGNAAASTQNPGKSLVDATDGESDRMWAEVGKSGIPSMQTITQLSGNLQQLYACASGKPAIPRETAHTVPKGQKH